MIKMLKCLGIGWTGSGVILHLLFVGDELVVGFLDQTAFGFYLFLKILRQFEMDSGEFGEDSSDLPVLQWSYSGSEEFLGRRAGIIQTVEHWIHQDLLFPILHLLSFPALYLLRLIIIHIFIISFISPLPYPIHLIVILSNKHSSALTFFPLVIVVIVGS